MEIDNNPLDLLSFIDLAPTVLSIAGIDIPDYIQGTAFLGDQRRESPKLLFSGSDRFDEQVDRLRAVFDGQYKYIKSYDSSKPHAIPVTYRLQMPMMQELLKLLKEDKLNEKQKFWFNAPKPSEEFYDLKNDPYELINNPNVDLIIEVMGGIDIAKDIIIKSLKARKSVVTANKAVIARYGSEIYAMAAKYGVYVLTEAAVCGGIPIIEPLKRSLKSNQINKMIGNKSSYWMQLC